MSFCRESLLMIGLVAASVAIQTVRSAAADVAIRPSGEHGVRITLTEAEGELKLNAALVDQSLPEPALRLKAGETKTKGKVGNLLVTVTANPLTVRIEDAAGRKVQQLDFAEPGGQITFDIGDGPVLGLGGGAQQFDRRGTIYQVRNGQVSNLPNRNGQMDGLATLGGRIHVPFLIGTSGWAMFVGTPIGEFDLRKDRGVFTPQPNSPAGYADVFVIDAREPANAMSEFIRLTGAPVMPPKWALGYMQSHRTLSTEADLLAEAKKFRDEKLPCDAVIYLGTGFIPAGGWNYGHNSFELNKDVFEHDPATVFKSFHDLNFHVILHVVPQNGNTPLFRTLHGQIPPAADETIDRTDMGPYWEKHKELFAAGVDGWWPDEGDWLDIPGRLARHRLYYQGPIADRPNVRPWNLQRNGYAGISQYGGWVWSGDVQSTWNTLAEHVSVGQNFSLSVSPFWGTDIGGFWPSRANELTGELYTRWFQFAAFCPSFRSHGRTWHLHTPYGWNTGETGPVEARPLPAESELHNAEVEPICRDYLNLRYQLMPYTYTVTREARDTGLPLMRALWLHYPTDAQAVERGDEYLWGRDLLVAPVVEKGAKSREVYLPHGDWYDWWTNDKQSGQRKVTKEVDLKTMPLYVRAGAIIPFDPVRQYMDETVSDPTTIRIYRGADGHFVMYDDDGKSLEYLHGAGTWTSFHWNDQQRKLAITLDPRTHDKLKGERKFDVLLLPENQHKTVTFTGAPVEVQF